MTITRFTFSRNELKDLLKTDIVPTVLANTWNSVVVNRQIASPHLSIFDSIRRTEYMVRLLQQGDAGETVYHGSESYLSPNDRRDGKAYYQISTGYSFKRIGHLSLGGMRPGTIAVPEAVGVLTPGFGFPTKQGLETVEAGQVYFDYSKSPSIDVWFAMDRDALTLQEPKTRESAAAALRILGDAILSIQNGVDVDFAMLRKRLISDAGLQEAPATSPYVVAKQRKLALES